tara:strand:+ start:1434 stop:3026 length:1593 start_codon:yes stop_codon:yes gene_type:complete
MSKLYCFLFSILLSFSFSINYLDDIQPIFDASCTSCHNSNSPTYGNHQLDLTSYSELVLGGESGDVIIPYDASSSILWQEVTTFSMPPYGSGNDYLSTEQVDLISEWINDGALEESEEEGGGLDNWDCQNDSDCMDGEFCAIECFTGGCGIDDSELEGTLGQYCQPCDECQIPEDAVSGNCDACETSDDGGDDGAPDCMADCEGIETVDPDVDANAFCEWYMDAYQETGCLDDCSDGYDLMIEQIYFMCELCLPTGNCDEMWNSEDCSELEQSECELTEDCIWDDYNMSCEDCGCECLNSCGCEGDLECEWDEDTYTCEDSTTDDPPECWVDCEGIDSIENGTGTEFCTWFISTYDEGDCLDDCSDCGPENNIYIICETCMDMDDGACDDWFSEEDNCEELDQDDCEFSEECSWNDYDMLCEDYNGGDDDDGGGELDNNLIIQDTYKINSVYPNPFNPTTTIMYQIPEFSNISIDVYNMNGQMIQNLHSGFKNPGEYSIIWNASNVTSGIYLIKLVSGSFIETQKVILIK